MTQQENFGAGDIIRCLISEGESCRRHLKALQMYSQLAGERTRKGRTERQKASLLGGGQEGSSHRHEREDKGRKSPETLLEGGVGGRSAVRS